MNYELAEIEWKLNPEEIKKKFLLFHDCRILERNIWGNPVSNDSDLGLIIKSTAYQVITNEYRSFFIKELHSIKTTIADHRIDDLPDKFGRYIRTNYAGLLKLKNDDHSVKPPPIEFNKPGFEVMYEKCTLRQIRYYLQVLFVAPLLKYIEEEYRSEIMPSPYVHSISQQKIKEQQSTPKLKWNGKVNQLVTFFYDLSNDVVIDGEPALSASQNEIAEFIVNNFVDKNDNDLSLATVKTILSPGKADKRSPEHKKYQVLKK